MRQNLERLSSLLQRDGTTRVGATSGEDKPSAPPQAPNAANVVAEEQQEVGGNRVKRVAETGKEEL